MPGTRPQVSWLLDALPAFDGTRVGLVFGGRLSEGEAPEPLYLHDKRSADAALTLTGQSPAYLVMRRELLSELRPGGGLLGPLLASVQGALEKNWAVGHRLTRGLSKPTYPRRMLGESFGCLRVAEIHGEGGPGLAREALLGFLALGWEAYKGRGRLTKDQRELALGITRGSVQRLRRERRRR
jgi:hypothetical protein